MKTLRKITGRKALRIEPSVRRLAGSAALSLSPPGSEDDCERTSRTTAFYMRGLLLGRFVAARRGDALIVWERPRWDRDVTGIDCAAIRILGGAECGPLLRSWTEGARKDGVEYSIARIPAAGPADESVEALRSSGFDKIEEIVWMHSQATVAAPGKPSRGEEIFEAGRSDSDDLAAVASRSFEYDRFHSDPVFDRETADRVHAVWAAGLVERQGVVVLAARREGRIAGYVALVEEGSLPRASGLVEMIAVDPRFRRSGLGTSLMRAAAARIVRRGGRTLFLCTQEHNVPAVALYEHCGFETYGRSATWRIDLMRRGG